MNEALQDVISGAMSFTAHVCTDVGGVTDGRRQLSTSSDAIVVETDATVRDAAYVGSAVSKDDIINSAQSALADSVATGALSDAIIDVIATLDPLSPLRAAEISATMPPSSSPTSFSSQLPQIAEGWENTAIVITFVNLVLIIGFCLYMRKTLGSDDRLSNMNLLAIVLGWIDMVSDCLFGVEVGRAEREKTRIEMAQHKILIISRRFAFLRRFSTRGTPPPWGSALFHSSFFWRQLFTTVT